MGLFIALETENGNKLERVEDGKNILHRILPSKTNDSYKLIHFIDWYGDTIFNRVQMEALLSDLQILIKNKVHAKEETDLVHSIIKMCERCLNEPHLYVKFYGD